MKSLDQNDFLISVSRNGCVNGYYGYYADYDDDRNRTVIS